MEKIQIIFNYNGLETTIQSDYETKFNEIYKSFKSKTNTEQKILFFMYNGILIQNEESTFKEIANDEDKKRKKMNILVNEIEKEGEIQNSPIECVIKSKNIICPKCKKDIKIKFDNYIISLFECKNKDRIDNIFLDKFDSTQNIDKSKIICHKCNKYNKANVHNNIFYRCNTCKFNLCPICYSNHYKDHKVIDYDDKNYICEKHNKAFTQYCQNCKENICIYCEQTHEEHKIISFGRLIPNENKLNNLLEPLKEGINKLFVDINDIIYKLNKIKKNFECYYNINESIIKNFNQEKLN